MTAEIRSVGRSNAVLVVDDEPDIRELIELTLVRMGLEVAVAGSISEAKARLVKEPFDLCLTDMRLGDGEGLELVRHIAARSARIPVAVITAYGSAENAVAALKAGAFDYVSKPVGLDELRRLVRAALALPTDGAPLVETGNLLGSSTVMRDVRDMVSRLARTQAPVHISGESGSGKELAARLIHERSARRSGPFVPVNCGAVPEALMEGEFFGHRKGAFTGADQEREGLFRAAHGGTLFLDEVGDLPLHMQVKLLRVIQEKRVRKVGATQEDAVDVRVISATHHDLAAKVAAGEFRQDLYYRLNVIELRMPPLRERAEDIPALAEHLLGKIAARSVQVPARLGPEAVAALSAYSFPGNVRELENMLERATALSQGDTIHAGDLGLAPVSADAAGTLPERLDHVERELIQRALDETRFNRAAAARLLGISVRQLRYRMQRLGIRERGVDSGAS